MEFRIGVWAAVLVFPAAAAAQDVADILFRIDRYHLDEVVDATGASTRTVDSVQTVLDAKALDAMKTTSLAHSTSVETLEVLHAFTEKPDGRRIEVPKANYQVTINRGQEAGPALSDWTTVELIYPELAVGDRVALRYRVRQSEAIFPGHFSTADQFGKHIAFDDVRVTVDVPASMPVRHSATGMQEKVRKANGRRILEWRWANPRPVVEKRRNFSVIDTDAEVGYAVSTFRDYAQIAQAYGERARPRAEATPEVRKLAEEIVGSASGEREQARLLYEWVATEIGYAGNCIGVGAVVPRELSFVIGNRLGDCKDHATLLQALLSARGIASTQALVNAGSSYRLPRIPVGSMVNHVITYLPSMNLFLDSTSDSTPFGMLPFQVAGKPVILVDGHRDGLRTPSPAPGESRQEMRTVAAISEDGSIEATMEVEQHGTYAAGTREWARKLPREQEKELVTKAIESRGAVGSGTLEKDDPTALADSYRYTVRLKMNDYIQRPGAGAFAIGPLFGSAAPVHRFVWSATAVEDKADVACSPGASVETYEFQLPPGLEVLSVPEDFKVQNEHLAYEASYRVDGHRLLVRRSFDDRTPGPICSPEFQAAYKALALKAMQNMKAQVLYK